jgi:hypothetical protein
MRSLRNPSATMRIIVARTTSRYGDVYLAALCSRVARSSRVSVMANGLRLDTGRGLLRPRAYHQRPAEYKRNTSS